MKIIFMGTPEFAVPTLHKLLNSHHQITAVFTQRPKPQDRGLLEKKSPIHLLSEQNNIPVYTPKTLKDEEIINLVKKIEADIIIVVAYGFIVPKAILEAKKYGCLNLHPSSLPRFRGPAPLQHTIIAGDTSTDICIIQMDEGLDTGDIILKQHLELNENITLSNLHDKCSQIGADLFLQILQDIDNIKPIPQSIEGLVYAPKLTKAGSIIDWNKSAYQIDCQIRGMTPQPGAFFKYKGENIKILEAKYEVKKYDILPGTIIDDKLGIACGENILRIKRLQKPSKKPVSGEEFLRGYKLSKGDILE